MYCDNDDSMFVKGEIKINKETDFIVTIDGNQDFTQPWGSLYVAGIPGEPENDEIIRRINRHHLTLPFGYKVVSNEVHGDGHIEFEMFDAIHCLTGTDGQKYHPDLREIFYGAYEQLAKGMDPNVVGHSIAMSPQFSGHISTLRRRGFKRGFVDGWAFTHCVGDGAIAYAEQWFEMYVIRDATRSVPPPHGMPEVMTEKLRLNEVKFVLSKQLVG